MTSSCRPSQPRSSRRDRQRGAVAIVVAAILVGLFAMAALAVDAGFMYQSQRGLQTAADAAVMAGLPTMSTANAIAMAGTNGSGYPTANIGATISGNNLTVTINALQPRFFGSIFGLPAKTLHVTSVGQSLPALPAIFSLNTSCAGVGVRFDGGTVAITGKIKSAGPMSFMTGPAATTSDTITYGSSCPVPVNHGEAFAGGAPTPGVAGADPLGYTLASFPVANCSFGTTFAAGTVTVGNLPGVWQSGNSGGGVLNTGVICSGGDITFSGTNVSGSITMVAAGNINGSGTGITLSPAPNGHGLVAFSNSTAGDGGSSGCVYPEAISFGSTDWTVDGNVYAPKGCISIGGTNVDVTGSLVGLDVDAHGDISVNSTTGGVGGYYLYQ
jgi:hypothetical protein